MTFISLIVIVYKKIHVLVFSLYFSLCVLLIIPMTCSVYMCLCDLEVSFKVPNQHTLHTKYVHVVF